MDGTITNGRLSGRRTLLVTGGLGFIGSHFIDLALSRGHRVINFDKQTYAANRDLVFTGDYHYKKADIAEIEDVPHCDAIVNFAAESHVDNSIAGTGVFMRSNVQGVHNLLDILARRKLKNLLTAWACQPPLFVQISTDEVFGDILEGAFKEHDRHKPSNPYAATKSCAEQLVTAWGRTYGLPYLITRTTNNYGPRQHPEKLIPSTITRLLAGRRAVVHGNGSYIRNWIHVEDNVSAIYTLIDGAPENHVYHIASDEEYSVEQVVKRICALMKRRYADWVDTSSDRSGADQRYALDTTRTRALGWKPRRTFANSLPGIIDHYKERPTRHDTAVQSLCPPGHLRPPGRGVRVGNPNGRKVQ